jgi:hypothetical protein
MKWHEGMFTGCLPRTDVLGARFPVFENTISDIIPRANWPGIISQREPMRPLVQKIKYQQYGSCASHATTQAFEVAWNQAYGIEDWIEFSPMSIYPFVSRRANSGSTLSDNLEYIQDSGLLPVPGQKYEQFLKDADIPVHTREENDYYGSFPTGWKDTARYFRAVEVFDIGSYEGLVTALLMGFPCVVGRSGHAICHLDPQGDGSSIAYANSWSPNWGDSGFGVDTERAVSGAISSYGCFALRTVYMHDKFIELMRD